MNKLLRSEARKRLKKFIQNDSEQTPAPVFSGLGMTPAPARGQRATSSRLLLSLHLGSVIVSGKDVVEHVGDEFELLESCFKFDIGAVLRLQNEGRALVVLVGSELRERLCGHGYFLPVLKPSPTTRERRERCSAALSPQRLPSKEEAPRLHRLPMLRPPSRFPLSG